MNRRQRKKRIRKLGDALIRLMPPAIEYYAIARKLYHVEPFPIPVNDIPIYDLPEKP